MKTAVKLLHYLSVTVYNILLTHSHICMFLITGDKL